jgi:hypothetical protein
MRGTGRSDQADRGRRRLRASAVIACVIAVILLALSVTAAAQTESTNPTLVLEQLLNGEVACVSADATCSAVDLYGRQGNRNTGPINPGDRLSTTVQLRNAGNITASGLHLSADACQNQALDGGTALADLCDTVTVAVDCAADGTTFSLEPQTLGSFGQDAHTVAAPLAPGASATCRFDVAYPTDRPAITERLRAVQPVTWTLMAPDVPGPGPGPGQEPGPGQGRGLEPAPGPSGGVTPEPAPPSRGPLAFTGGDALLLSLAGLALLIVGAVLHRLSRHHGRGDPWPAPAP